MHEMANNLLSNAMTIGFSKFKLVLHSLDCSEHEMTFRASDRTFGGTQQTVISVIVVVGRRQTANESIHKRDSQEMERELKNIFRL